jgi:hypothetical protein
MNYLGLFTTHDLALLSDWLAESGELYVNVYHPRSGLTGTPFLTRSVQDLRSLVAQQTWPELYLTIFRHLPYPVLGIADDNLLKQALNAIPDGNSYQVVSLEHYFPAPCPVRLRGESHAELWNEFPELQGQKVAIGQDPDEMSTLYRGRPEEAFILHVAKSTNYHEEYAKHPEKYNALEQEWREGE